MKIVLASKSGVRKEILSKNNIKFDVFPSNINESEQIYISNLRIKGSKSEIEQFVNSKYGLLLEIESRLPDLDQQNRKMSISMYKKTPLTLILLKLFLLP